jgi:cytochrome c-type biogenesis protein CcmH
MKTSDLAAIIAVVLAMGGTAAAQDTAYQQEPAYKKEARDLSREIMSPFCPGLTMLDCPSPGAADVRDWIAEELKAGVTHKEIKDQLYEQYGEVVLPAPRARGFGLVVWALPGIFLVAGAGFITVWARRRHRVGAGFPATPTLDPEAAQRIEEELAKM